MQTNAPAKSLIQVGSLLFNLATPFLLQELANQDTVRALKLEHSKEITKLRQAFELQAKELQQKYEVCKHAHLGISNETSSVSLS